MPPRNDDDDTSTAGMYLSIFLWAIVPGLVTSILHRIYYAVRYPIDSRTRPISGSPKYQLHYRRIYTVVVAAYLAFTVIEAYVSLPASHYVTLNLDPQKFTVKELKQSFKKLSLLHHPDKHQGDDKEFIKIRAAYETLNDPNRRYIYDRWSNDGTQCQSCKILRDYIYHAAPVSVAFYAGTGFVLALLNMSGRGEFGRFWRFIVFFSLALAEAWLVLYSESTPFRKLSNAFMPKTTPSEQVHVLRQVYISLFIAISQLGPLYFPQTKPDLDKDLIEVAKLSDMLVRDASGSVKTVLEPFSGSDAMVSKVKAGMGRLAAELRLFENPEYARGYGQAMEKFQKSRKSAK